MKHLIIALFVLSVSAQELDQPFKSEFLESRIKYDFLSGELFAQGEESRWDCNAAGRITYFGIDTGLYWRNFCVGSQKYKMDCFGGKINVTKLAMETCGPNGDM